MCIFKIHRHKMYTTIAKGRYGSIVKKYWTQAKLVAGNVNIKSCSSMHSIWTENFKGFRWSTPPALVPEAYISPLDWFFSLFTTHLDDISCLLHLQCLVSPMPPWLHHHSFTHGFSQPLALSALSDRDSGHAPLGPINSPKQFVRIHDPSLLHFHVFKSSSMYTTLPILSANLEWTLNTLNHITTSTLILLLSRIRKDLRLSLTSWKLS